MVKISGILAGSLVAISLAIAPVLAAPDSSCPAAVMTSHHKGDGVKVWENPGEKCGDWEKDPVRALQEKKEKTRSLLKEGKISKEEADAINAKIDARIKDIREFNKLNLQQKKDKLTKDFKESMDRKVKEGKLTREKAEAITKEFNEKVEKWDGKGYPRFHKRDCKYKD